MQWFLVAAIGAIMYARYGLEGPLLTISGPAGFVLWIVAIIFAWLALVSHRSWWSDLIVGFVRGFLGR